MLNLTVAVADPTSTIPTIPTTLFHPQLVDGTIELERRRVGVHNSLQTWTCTQISCRRWRIWVSSANCDVRRSEISCEVHR